LGASFNEKYCPYDLGAFLMKNIAQMIWAHFLMKNISQMIWAQFFQKMPPKIHLNDFGYFISENSQIFIGNFFG
jgi:hypothetical protein